MIARYTLPEMGQIWTDENRYAKWLDVELAACRAWNKLGRIPGEALAEIEAKAAFEVARVEEIEAETRHDVIAFLTNVAEHVGPSSRYIHLGLTSSDVLDTAYALLIKESGELILAALDRLLAALKTRALEHKYTLQMGRSHGIHAEPVTFGLKLVGFYAEFARDRERLERAIDAAARGKISGAVGTYANVTPEVETMVMADLGLTPAVASTQVVSRDGLAEYFCTLAIIGGSIERLAVEIRHMQRTEVLEAEEAFAKGQKGSSAMPHKRNPIGSENLSGQVRLLRGYALAALENMALWHERDISHSSVERTIGPDADTLTHYSLHRMAGMIERLTVYPENMQRNLNLTGGLIHSQQVLLALAQSGISREDAYRLVQQHAMATWAEGGSFRERLENDPEVSGALGEKTGEILDGLFDPKAHLKQVDYIFEQILGKD
ncbi:MAG: adenylosuccinate lyase [Desulfarculus sp.]|nr:adenylosuccinate lyase [Pseudomonadota bacterium]MBV1717571.1 adenylosuccinate lyase [Desulfarculus sp.]MBU4575243.1 adenylosuccinate lyase [Pseudomonadota bacterium]MBU4598180.1 adenylosuccinate lyase [Pseudomonadota bacterium]MBV1737880.1 adenylosuccinate lyase [Desulfarculus sp.]